MLSLILNRAAHSPLARQVVEGFGPTRRVVDRFVAGARSEDAVRVARDLSVAGRSVTIDVLGEDVTEPDQARATVSGWSRVPTWNRTISPIPASGMSTVPTRRRSPP